MTPSWNLHVCMGDPKRHEEELRRCERERDTDNWTINSKAAPGDRVVFYLKGPLSSFVAVGIVASHPEKDDGTKGWAGHYMADVSKIRMLPTPVHLRDVRKAFPKWDWLRQPRRSTAVPLAVVDRFLKLLDNVPVAPDRDLVSELEGITTEVVRLTSSRSRRLRDLAMKQAQGVCCVCDRDFSGVLGGKGVRVLQVHHRRQLAASELPHRTKLDDLAVVCANCHMLLHMDPKKALRVGQLRRMLSREV